MLNPTPNRDQVSGIRILLTDTARWPVVPRLAIAFAEAGCEVAVLCPLPGHPVERTRCVRRIFPYSGYSPLASLRSAVEAFDPHIVVPVCDRGVQHLHQLFATTQREGGAGTRIAATIERSLGAPEAYPVASCRCALLQAAESEGILVPRTAALNDLSDLQRWRAESSLPWVLKADGTSGGRGVRFVSDEIEAESLFRELAQRPSLAELAKRLLLNRDRGWSISDWRPSRRSVIAQSLIAGRPANCAVVCWEGRVLAGIAVEVVAASSLQGPATVVEVVPGAEMLSAAEKLAARLGISGFFGLDFMIESGTGAVYLIEMNPRCTPLCPLPLGKGSDLIAALVAQLAGQPAPDSEPVTTNNRIAYFPQAWTALGDRPDELLSGAYHDVPEGEPDLIHELLHPWPERSRLGQIADRARRNRDRRGGPITFIPNTDAPCSPADRASDSLPCEAPSV